MAGNEPMETGGRGRAKGTAGDAVQGAVGQAADQLAARAVGVADAALGSAELLAERTVELGRQASESVKDVGETFHAAILRSVSRQPVTTVLLAVGVGMILGRWRRR